MQDAKQLLVEAWASLPYLIAFLVVISNIPTIIYGQPLGSSPTMISKISLDSTRMQITNKFFSSACPDRNCIVGIVIPSTRHRNIPADNSYYVKEAKFLFASKYRGYIALPNAEGGWILEDIGELIEEPGVLVLALVTKEDLNATQDILVAFGLYLKRELDQEAVSIIINGNLKFV